MVYAICSRKGHTSMGRPLSLLTIDTDAALEETDVRSNAFQIEVGYTCHGLVNSTHRRIIPVSGNRVKTTKLGFGLTLHTQIKEWEVSDTLISFKLTAALSGPWMGPDYIYQDTVFRGDRSQVAALPPGKTDVAQSYA